ncbi:MAG: IS1595 family transposase [Hyphomicrobium sp.]|nr:IS1595 family transposase [Hyphomicrobium sp.]
MARNPVQMQKGLSLTEFQARYGSEEQCRAAVAAWRWPKGFMCPHCGSSDHAVVGKRQLYLCHDCLTQTSLKAGTIFAKSLLPLTKWFQGMYLLTQSKNSISGLELARQLGVRPDTASLMRHKLMSVMSEREASRKLDGRVEMDDVVLGGEKREIDGGKRGRGGPNKTPFVAAVETSKEGHPLRLLLHVVKSHDGEAIEAMAKAHLTPGCRVVSDGLGCFRAVTKAGCVHEPVNATKANDHGEKLACFRWVNTVLGKLKTAIAGTLKSVARRYVHRYLAEFQYRFNRRFRLPEMLARPNRLLNLGPG